MILLKRNLNAWLFYPSIRENKGKNSRWICRCDCGAEVIVFGYALKNGNTKSCGCLQKELAKTVHTTHSFAHISEYRIWRNIKQRCYNPKHDSYKDYGGRGITMCDEWKESFEAFYRDMGPRPSHHHSIDRRDNDKGYSKDNCRWATWEEQNSNKRNSVFYEYKGIFKTLPAWCRELNLNYSTMKSRIDKGLTLTEALSP